MTDTTTNVVGILLAAGRSRRFEGNKLIAKLPNSVPIGIQSAVNLKSCVDELIVVVNPIDVATKQAFNHYGFKVEVSELSRSGMGHSLSHGVSCSAGATHWIVGLADMPHLKEHTLSKLKKYLVQHNQITVPVFGTKIGHPVGFPLQYKTKLLKLSGDRGARGILDANTAETFFFMSSDSGTVRDIDFKLDLSNSNSR